MYLVLYQGATPFLEKKSKQIRTNTKKKNKKLAFVTRLFIPVASLYLLILTHSQEIFVFTFNSFVDFYVGSNFCHGFCVCKRICVVPCALIMLGCCLF